MKREGADAWERLASAHALIACDDARAADALRRCWQDMDTAADAAGRLCVAAAMCECLHVQRRDFRDYEQWRARLAAELAAGSATSLAARGAAQELRALIGIGWAAQIRPFDGWDDIHVAQRIEGLLQEAGGAAAIDADLYLHAAAAAMRCYGHQDDMVGIEAIIARATPRCDEAGTAARLAWLQAAGISLAFSMPGPRGLQLLAEARELAARQGQQAALFEVCHDEIFLRLGRDGPTGLKPLFEQLERASDPTRLYDVARRHHLSARRALHDAGDSGSALYYAQAAVELVERSSYPVHDAAMLYVTLAYACARRGDVQSALAAVEKVAAQASGNQQRQQQSIALFLRAYALLLNEPLPHAAVLLQQAFAEAEHLQWFGFRPVPEVAARLVEAALRLDIDEAAYARRLIGLRNLTAPGYSAAWPWAVRIVTLGRFELRIRDTPLAADGKLPRKTLELLQYVAGSPQLTVAADRLTASLWPELDGDMARGAFRTALHRLRKLLGDAEAVVFDGASVRLDAARVWVDALAFERLADAVGHELQRGHGVRARFDGLEALALYGGHFLADPPEAAWLLGAQQRLRSRLQRLTITLGDHFERGGDSMQARALYARAIELDPLDEEIARRLMTLLQTAGEASAALEVYRALRQRLSVELGQAPSAQTQRLVERLRGERADP